MAPTSRGRSYDDQYNLLSAFLTVILCKLKVQLSICTKLPSNQPMIGREITPALTPLFKQYPVVTVTG